MCYASSTIYYQGWVDFLSGICLLVGVLSGIFPSNIGMYPPYGAGPASKKIICYLQNIREFSEYSRNSLEKVLFSEIKHIYNTLYTVYTRFSHCIQDFCECSHNSLVGMGFYSFVFLWPTTISPRNASLGSSRRCKMVKACSLIIFHCW